MKSRKITYLYYKYFFNSNITNYFNLRYNYTVNFLLKIFPFKKNVKLKDYTDLKASFGSHIKEIREGKGLSLIEVDQRCELDESYISKIENGKKNIQLSTIFELSKGLGVEPRVLLDFKI